MACTNVPIPQSRRGSKFGGNGGLSLRRVSRVLQVLKFQKRLNNEASEDQWLVNRLRLLQDANMAPSEIETAFGVEDVYHPRPMGYHLNPGSWSPEVWGDLEKRKAMFEYCPELKILLDARLERERCRPADQQRRGRKRMAEVQIGVEDDVVVL